VLGTEQVGAHGRLEIERRLGAPASTGAVLGAPAHALGQRLERLAEGFATGQAPTYLHAISRNQSQAVALNRNQSQSVALSRNQASSTYEPGEEQSELAPLAAPPRAECI
jgi:microcystin-dependent protein